MKRDRGYRLCSIAMTLLMLLASCVITAYAGTDGAGEFVSRIDPASLTELDAVADTETVDVDILFLDTDNGAEKRELLIKLLAESDSALLRACPAVDDLNELENDLFSNITAYNQYSDVFRESRRQYFEGFNQEQYHELIREYAIAPTLIYASRYTPSIQLRMTKADLIKIQYDESILSIARYEDQPAADDEAAVEDAEHLFEDQYQAFVTEAEADGMDYKELWYHRNEKGAVDWALVYFFCLPASDEPDWMLAADRVYLAGSVSAAFPFGYGVYDAAEEKFIPVYELRHRLDDYPGLYEALWKMNVGRPIGDADGDSEITILDATYIQRVLAGLNQPDEEDSYSAREDNHERIDGSLSDADRDGEVTILDAACIQRRLAGLTDDND